MLFFINYCYNRCVKKLVGCYMTILNGKELAKNLQAQLKLKAEQLTITHQVKPHLVGVLVGENVASEIYVKNKVNACNRVGITVTIHRLPATTTQQQLNQTLTSFSSDDSVHGILLQLPLPNHLNVRESISHIAPQKDVDGLTNQNLGKLVSGETDGLVACTAQGIVALLKHYKILLAGKHCVIVGRSLLVGKPLFHLLLAKDAYVTICHSKTPNLQEQTKNADVLITAVGKKNLITSQHVKQGAVVVDVAMVRDGDHLCGDVNAQEVANIASYLSPVPGGVGPLTVTMLLNNTLQAFENQMQQINK